MKKVAIIPSGGGGKRCGGSLPKQYVKINEKELIVYTLQVFQNCQMVDAIYVAVKNEYINTIYELKEKYNISKLVKAVEGGKERQDSVFNALQSIKLCKDDIVIIHDAARPLLDSTILINTIKDAEKYGAAVAAIKAKDTLFSGKEFLESHLNRENMYYAQTPQIFKGDILLNSMKKAYQENFIGTDESSLVRRAGYKIKISEGSDLNFKITTAGDIKLFEKIISNSGENYL